MGMPLREPGRARPPKAAAAVGIAAASMPMVGGGVFPNRTTSVGEVEGPIAELGVRRPKAFRRLALSRKLGSKVEELVPLMTLALSISKGSPGTARVGEGATTAVGAAMSPAVISGITTMVVVTCAFRVCTSRAPNKKAFMMATLQDVVVGDNVGHSRSNELVV
jgi:hypothetical protein